jgi:hypothetical protein
MGFPVCSICGRKIDVMDEESGLIRFKPTQVDKAWIKANKGNKRAGLPPNAQWFCGVHHYRAQVLSKKTKGMAWRTLSKEFEDDIAAAM